MSNCLHLRQQRADIGKEWGEEEKVFCLSTASVCVEAFVKVYGASPTIQNILKIQTLLWFSHCSSRAKKTSHKFDSLRPVRGSGLGSRIGKERWTGHRGTVIYFQKVQTFTMYCSGAGGVSQELLLDVGA